MRRPRLKLRTLLLAVAAAALAMCGVRAWLAREQRLRATRLAAFHADKESRLLNSREWLIASDRRLARYGHAVTRPRDAHARAEDHAVRAAYHAELRQKYEWLAAHPWATVEPDPQPPPLKVQGKPL
jgi:hypothetical protein